MDQDVPHDLGSLAEQQLVGMRNSIEQTDRTRTYF